MSPHRTLDGMLERMRAAPPPHGKRARYVLGCRCEDCRRANREYATERNRAQRRGDWNGLVSADAARAHIEWLSARNVGRDAVAAASDVAVTIICEIRQRKRRRIRARTEARILAVTTTCRLDRAIVASYRTRKQLAALREEGYTVSELARRLGYRGRAVQVGDKITVRNADRIERLFVALTGDAAVRASFGKPWPAYGRHTRRAA